MAMQRTELSPRCWATSSTSRAPLFIGLQRVENRRQVALELHVDDGADHLGDVARRVRDSQFWPCLTSSLSNFLGIAASDRLRQSASAPEMISISSLVIIAWRVRL